MQHHICSRLTQKKRTEWLLSSSFVQNSLFLDVRGLQNQNMISLQALWFFPNTFHHASRQILAERVIGSLLKVCFAEQKKLSLKTKNWIFNLKKRAAKKTSEKSLFFEESQNPQIGFDISYLQSQSSLTVCFFGGRGTTLYAPTPHPSESTTTATAHLGFHRHFHQTLALHPTTCHVPCIDPDIFPRCKNANSSPRKIGPWKFGDSYLETIIFRGRAVRFREGIYIYIYIWHVDPHFGHFSYKNPVNL